MLNPKQWEIRFPFIFPSEHVLQGGERTLVHEDPVRYFVSRFIRYYALKQYDSNCVTEVLTHKCRRSVDGPHGKEFEQSQVRTKKGKTEKKFIRASTENLLFR